MSSKLDPRVERAIADARAYVAKPATENLASFREYAAAIFRSVLLDAKIPAAEVERILDVAGPIAGTYSRYQDAKRNGTLAGIVAAGRPARPARTTKPATKPAPKSDATA